MLLSQDGESAQVTKIVLVIQGITTSLGAAKEFQEENAAVFLLVRCGMIFHDVKSLCHRQIKKHCTVYAYK